LSRPELAVLMAYSKIVLFDQLLDSPVPDDPYLGKELFRYFPARMAKHFPDEIAEHKLKREIISTMLANSMINRGGASFVSRASWKKPATAWPTSPRPMPWRAIRSTSCHTQRRGRCPARAHPRQGADGHVSRIAADHAPRHHLVLAQLLVCARASKRSSRTTQRA
jgi:hypothetical protein